MSITMIWLLTLVPLLSDAEGLPSSAFGYSGPPCAIIDLHLTLYVFAARQQRVVVPDISIGQC
jgi:hypothetical protein